MNPEQAMKSLANRTIALRDVPADALEVLNREVKAAASVVRATAAHSRHNIDIRVLARGNSVRVTIVGQQAARYRALLSRELDSRVPNAKAEIRTIAKGKAR